MILPGGWHLYTTITIIIAQCYDIYNLIAAYGRFDSISLVFCAQKVG